jgi:hypothetical protein
MVMTEALNIYISRMGNSVEDIEGYREMTSSV